MIPDAAASAYARTMQAPEIVTPSEPEESDVTRRTLLAAERTWLAWWRSGIAAITAAVAVGGVVPELVEGSQTPYIVLGAGYAALGGAVFLAAAARRRQVDEALRRNEWVGVSDRGVIALTLAALALAMGTLVIIIAQP
jgi:putative membrane protein